MANGESAICHCRKTGLSAPLSRGCEPKHPFVPSHLMPFLLLPCFLHLFSAFVSIFPSRVTFLSLTWFFSRSFLQIFALSTLLTFFLYIRLHFDMSYKSLCVVGLLVGVVRGGHFGSTPYGTTLIFLVGPKFNLEVNFFTTQTTNVIMPSTLL